MKRTNASRLRGKLSHPVIDADGHWIESAPVFFDYVREMAGPDVLRRVQEGFGRRVAPWYLSSPDERLRKRMNRPGFWGLPTNAEELATSMAPARFYERLDDWGIDVALLFPSMALGFTRELTDPALRMPVIKAYNTMVAEMFRPFRDRIIPVGIVGLGDPAEGIELLEHAHAVGLKQVAIGGSIPRRTDGDDGRVYVDGLGLDSPYDYDPVWQKFVDLKMPVATHSGSMGWPDRSSPTNFVANHLGHFAQSHHVFARSLFLGGVTQRFPDLNFAFLEGGVGWACNLYSDLMGHWAKRNRRFMHQHFKPTNLDRERLRELLKRYTANDSRFHGLVDNIVDYNLDPREFNLSVAEATARDLDTDDFAKVALNNKDDIRRLFAKNFYFGCEADDPMTAVAFNDKMGLRLKPVLGSDISHFDVIDPAEVLPEAFELVEHGLINEENFRDFTFANAARLLSGMNPDFFKGTIVEEAVAKVL